MRYAEAIFSEDPVAVGIFATGDTVTVQALDLSTDSLLTLTSNVATESVQIAGFFLWAFSNITTQPVDFTQVLVVMTNQNGRQHVAKMVTGGFPSDSAIRRYQNSVHIHTDGTGVSGTAFPVGTPDTPVDNLADARAIADARGFTKYVVRGSLTIDADHLGWVFEGEGDAAQNVLTVQAGVDVTASSFFQVTLLGDFSGGGRISVQECLIGTGNPSVTVGLQGVFNTVGIFGTIRPAASGSFEALDVASRSLIPGSTIDFNGVNATVLLGGARGTFRVVNNTNALGILGVAFSGGDVVLEASNTDGIYEFFGVGEVVDSKAGASSFVDNTVKGSRIDIATSAVWDEDPADHALVDTFGEDFAEIVNHVVGDALIDFAGNDLLGWQLVQRDVDDVEIARYNLFDEADARITGTVADFISNKKAVARLERL